MKNYICVLLMTVMLISCGGGGGGQNGNLPMMSNEEVTPPNEEAVLPDEEVVPPSEEAVLPDEEVVPPSEEVVLPDEEVVPPSEEVVLPDEEIVPPSEEAVLPDEEIVLPNAEVVLPDEEIVLPSEEAVLPDEEIVLPNAEVVPPSEEVIPLDEEIVLPNEEAVSPSEEVAPMQSAPPLKDILPTQFNPEAWGPWASFDQGYFRVEETMLTDSNSVWTVYGTPTGLVDNLPQIQEPGTFSYSGHVWGRVFEGRTGKGARIDEDDGDRVLGTLTATYGPRDHYGPGADDILNLHLHFMYKELPGGGRRFLPAMVFYGDVGTNRNDPDYDSALDTATFTLPAVQYETTPGRERGEATGSFYGPNGEVLAGTFWYKRLGHRIEGAFGGERGDFRPSTSTTTNRIEGAFGGERED